MTTLYHPDLPKGQNVIEVPDEAESTISVYEQSGWTTEVPKKHAPKSEAPSAPNKET